MNDDEAGCCGCGGGKKKPGKPMTPETFTQDEAAPKNEQDQRDDAPLPPDPEMQKAAARLGLSKQEADQVTKALEAEMERRRRWRRLLRTKGLKRTSNKPKPGQAKAIEDILGGGLGSDDESTKSTSEGAALKKGGGHGSRKSHSQKSTAPEQPDSLTVDVETAKQLESGMLLNMLGKVLAESKETEEREKKPPGEMTIDELIEFRKQNPKAWDEFTTANSVASFGLAKPTTADEEKGKEMVKVKKEQQREGQRISFDDRIVVASVPAGEDFRPGEEVQFKSARVTLKKEKKDKK